MDEELKFKQTETSATETVAEAAETADKLVAESTPGEVSVKKNAKEMIKDAFKPSNAWKNTKRLSKRWFIEAFTGMAQGLFVTLIAGTIVKTIGGFFDGSSFGKFIVLFGNLASVLMGAGIGAGIASHLKTPRLVVFASIVAGFIGAYSEQIIGANFTGGLITDVTGKIANGVPGNPIGAYVVALMACEIGNLVAGKTKLDILIVPLTCMIVSMLGVYIAYPFIWIINKLGIAIAWATSIRPFFMGIIIAVVMGILLTMPTSSAAIWVAVASGVLSGAASTPEQIDAMLIAGGAAVVGCACQMVGFAVMSFKENGVSGLVSQGIGTSMLQIPNIMKNPKVFIPPIVASAICGPIATCLFKLKCGASGGGMGTSGFVGIIDAFKFSVQEGDMNAWIFALAVILLFIAIPAFVSWGLGALMRKKGWIKDGDLSLDYNN